MSIENKSDLFLLELGREFADQTPSFDPTFLDQLCSFYARHGILTDKQRRALEKLITKNDILFWAEKNL